MNKKFSIIMATLNSMRTLELALTALRRQNYPQELVEILVVDGGSSDGTREMARRFGARVVDNPMVEPVSAKLIGLKEAQGDILMHVDSDEVLLCPDSLVRRARTFTQFPDVHMIFSTGYVTPAGAPFAAQYINEFGDPFSMFYYRLSKDSRFFIATARRRLPVLSEDEDAVVFQIPRDARLIMENAACGNCLDLAWFRRQFPHLLERPDGPVHFFYHMQQFTSQFAITKSDSVAHHSADRWSNFLKKITWRIRNNIQFKEGLGTSAFSGRESLPSGGRPWRKYFFMPYALLVIPAVVDACALIWTRRDWRYWAHVPLTLYTAVMIVFYMLAQFLGIRFKQTGYGTATVIAHSTKTQSSGM